jgi:hypothetical protein
MGSTLNEKVIQPATIAITDPNFQQNMSSYMNTITTSVVDAGNSGLSIATSGVDKAKKWMNEQGLPISPSERDQELWNQTSPISPNLSAEATPYNLEINSKNESKKDSDGGWDDF